MAFTEADLKHPAALQRVREMFARAAFLDFVGIRLSDVGPGWAETTMEVRPHHFQSEGFVHAGCQATIADHTSGAAAGTLMGPNQTVLAVEFKVTLMRPAIGERLRCRAEVVRSGRTLAFTEARLHAIANGQEKLVATFSGTVAIVST